MERMFRRDIHYEIRMHTRAFDKTRLKLPFAKRLEDGELEATEKRKATLPIHTS
jgi:hypothetical protein